MEQRRLEDELSELRAEVIALRARLDRLEGAAPVLPSPDGPAMGDATAAGPVRPAGRAAATFTGLAVVCFTLVGALVLRVATQQGWLGPGLGVGLGLSYCGLLLIGPAILRRAAFMVAYGGAMQACAVLLAPSIVLETFHRQDLLAAFDAAAILIAFGLIGGLVGGLLDRRAVAWLALLGGMAGLAGLGLRLDASVVRAWGVSGLLACSLGLAHARRWAALGSLAVLASGLLLGVAVLATAHREGIDRALSMWTLGAAGAAWLLVAVNHQARSAQLAEGEAAWLPLGTLWMAGLGLFYASTSAAWVGLGVGAGLLALTWWRNRSDPATVGLGVAGGLAASLGAGVLDPSGLGLACVALVCLGVARAVAGGLLAVLAQLVCIGAVVRFVAAVGPLGEGRPGLWIWPAGAALFGALVTHARLAEGRAHTQAGAWLAPVSLTGALVVAWAAVSTGLSAWLGPGDGVRFGSSALLALTGGGCLWFGTSRAAWRGVYGLGLAAVGLLAIKVLLVDLFAMGGAPLLGSFLVMGLAFGVTSLAMRRRARAAPGVEGGA